MRSRSLLLAAATTAALAAPALAHADPTTGGVSADGRAPAPAQPVSSKPGEPTVAGSRAKLVRGIAYAPAAAPLRVRRAIWATNRIVHRPYSYGGGHSRWVDRGYDCSGLVSYFLHAAGLLREPMSAPDFLSWGRSGRGRWVTVWARSGHVYVVVAGLRLDSTPWPDSGQEGSDWRRSLRDASAFTPRHPSGL